MNISNIPSEKTVPEYVTKGIAALHAKDEEGIKAFVDKITPALRHFARDRLQRNDQTLDDLIENTLLKVLKYLPEYDRSKGSFDNWLATLTYRTSVDMYRRTRLIPGAYHSGPDSNAAAQRKLEKSKAKDNPVANAIGHETAKIMDQVMGMAKQQAPSQLYDAYYQTEILGKSGEEAAQDLRTTATAVKVGKYKFKKILEAIAEEKGVRVPKPGRSL